MSAVRVWNDAEQRYVVISEGRSVYSPPSIRTRRSLSCFGGSGRACAEPGQDEPATTITSPAGPASSTSEIHPDPEMTGRLLGEVVLPPEDPANWSLAPSTIYGCPLCRIVNEHDASGCCHELRDHRLQPLNFSPELLPKHGLTISTREISRRRTFSICASMGHVYLRAVDPASFNPASYRPIEDTTLTLTTEDLSFGHLFIHQGKFYNRDATVVAGLKAEEVLIGLTKEHHKLVQFGLHGDLYHSLRNQYLQVLDEYLVPEDIKLDDPYGHRMVKMLVRAIDFNTYSGVKLERLKIKSAFGKVYRAQLPIDQLIFKYQVLSDQFESEVWETERRNSEFINRNLDRVPNLPYPYTYQMYRCGRLPDVEHLTQPSCPVGQDSIGVFVQEYVNSRGALDNFLEEFPNDGLNLLIEALAVLAEAHQGDTVQHHFMHLDAHTGNFLVSECGPKDRVCSLANNRTTNLGGFEYTFDTHGHRVFLIDFGLSHFLEDATSESYNSDLPDDLTLDSTLYPAYDFITLFRAGMSGLVVSALQSHHHHHRRRQAQVVSDESFDHLITAMQIGVAMMAPHLKRLARQLVSTAMEEVKERKNPLAHLPTYSHEDVDKVNVLNASEVVKLISDTWDTYLPELLIPLVEKFMRAAREAPPNELRSAVEVVNFLTGMAYQDIGKSKPYLDRNIYAQQLSPLPAGALERLAIEEPSPDLTGIPLYLWYLRAGGVPIAIR